MLGVIRKGDRRQIERKTQRLLLGERRDGQREHANDIMTQTGEGGKSQTGKRLEEVGVKFT